MTCHRRFQKLLEYLLIYNKKKNSFEFMAQFERLGLVQPIFTKIYEELVLFIVLRFEIV